MKKAIMLAVSLVALAGCASKPVKKERRVSPIELRKQKVYECVVELIKREVTALDAEKVCTNIYSKKRVR